MPKNSDYAEPPPDRRRLKIFAFDPMLGRKAQNRITIDVANEVLEKGPQGSRVAVIDYDGVNKCYYTPVNLNDPALLMQDGLDPTEADPRFHQQMVYAVTMKVIENFEWALGRRIYFHRRRKLRILPHAFQGANAFFDPKLRAVLFGYFRADTNNPGPNLPGQTVFTCLSHDIIAHEVTHALVHRLRPYFMEPTNRDVAAFHEGFADIVAIFQHFSLQEVLRNIIQETRSDLRLPGPLVDLASEFGYATGQGQALRSAVDPDNKPDPTLYQTVFEPHERGSILVAAVFDAFFTIYQRRIADLVRIATGGTGTLPEGNLHPDLVNRIATEAARTAQSILTMCIRAFEYLPPIDITFGDFLRALVTADFELAPADEVGQRAAMIEAFRARGIYPQNVTSLAEDSLRLEGPESPLPPLNIDGRIGQLLMRGALEFSRGFKLRTPSPAEIDFNLESQAEMNDPDQEEPEADLSAEFRVLLANYARQNAEALGLNPQRHISISGFHSAFRVAPRGQLLVELVAQFTQRDDTNKDAFGGIPLRGGTTLIASADGQIRYVIAKPLPHASISETFRRDAEARLARQKQFVADCDTLDAKLAWADEKYDKARIKMAMNFASIHSGIVK
jgi:hypothetical protein